MDLEDIANAVWVGMILVLAVLSGRSKRISGSGRKPSGNFDADKVRKRIETIGKPIKATRRPRNTDAQPSPSHRSRPDVPLSSVKRNFSAYKHLPKQTTIAENIPDATAFLTESKAPVVPVSASPVQRDVADKKAKLRERIIGQVILDVPAFRKNYGNFFNRRKRTAVV